MPNRLNAGIGSGSDMAVELELLLSGSRSGWSPPAVTVFTICPFAPCSTWTVMSHTACAPAATTGMCQLQKWVAGR